MSQAFDILSSALEEAIENEKAEQKFLTAETVSIEIEPLVQYTAEDIKAIRSKTGLTQSLFAKWFGVSTRTVEAWESGRNKPSGPSSRLLGLLQSNRLSIAN
ncbi:MAG: transcriptional regulator [Selenomonas ruminantium]|jgi:putative transcriptional regulator|uniref:Transcriptional regulator n=1 Tax=Selenomonas ruminantium TaxID=971 RepID=A0A927WL96_SELRU|nr:helix-turn-helix domain-containing protein [Selenomonas ruminantium]MBE6084843.1 transcriptional regulator [Selenomonas ruminantium]